jgi:pyridine nucleotide-disulfide oxidoreductase family protein
MPAKPAAQRLVLVGAGHAQLFVLAGLARRPLPPAIDVTLVAPETHALYSGMLPGWIAGHYRLDQCAIDLRPLARRARVRWIEARALGLDPQARRLDTEAGAIEFDWLSIACGSAIDAAGIDGAGQHALAPRPAQGLVDGWQRFTAGRRAAPAQRAGARAGVAVIGGGAAGVELALAIAQACANAPGLGGAAGVTLVAGNGLMQGFPAGARRRCERLLRQRAIDVLPHMAASIDGDGVDLADGRRLATGLVVLASGPAPQPWLRASGLACDDRGFLLVDRRLRSTSHPAIFAAGDCASIEGAPRARSGVYAVRAGPVLAANLRASLEQCPLRPHRPQRRALYLLSTGDRHAIGCRGPIVFEGDWVWRWKDRIDRRFIERFSVGE